MIDIEAKVLTAVRGGVAEAHEKCFVSGEYLRSETKLPAVTVIEQSNYVPVRAIDSSALETHAVIMYQVDVYSADLTSKKTEARAIMKTVDGIMSGMGFRRIYLQPTPNMNNATLYRLTARYQGSVTREGYVAR